MSKSSHTIFLILVLWKNFHPDRILYQCDRTTPAYEDNDPKSTSLSQAQIQWALSSYLMAKDNLSTIFISGNQQYGADLRYPAYAAAIGTPQGNMYENQQVYWRTYSNGLVIVNPSASTRYIVTLDKSYFDAYGNRVNTTLTLQPHSGIILLNS